MSKLSVIIIVKNEAKHIRRCLASVKFADQIVVLDSGSTDDTVAICKEFTQDVYETDWPGYGKQKIRALEKATHPWVLSIDADECLTPELQHKIESIIAHPPTGIAGFNIRRLSVFNNRVIKYANGSNKILRLFQRGLGHFTPDEVHESIIVNGKIGNIKEPMLHYSFENPSDLIKKIYRYTELSAQKKFAQGRRCGAIAACLRSAWIFFRVYVFNLGFLDGRNGLLFAASFGIGTFYKYMELAYLSEKAKSSTPPPTPSP